MAIEDSAEEYFSRRMLDARILEQAARRYAHPDDQAAQDAVAALACALGADVATLEAVVWERVHVAPRDPRRELFGVAEVVTARLADSGATTTPTSVRQVVEDNRRAIVDTFDDPVADSLTGRWPAIGYLGDVPAPSSAALSGFALRRMDGATIDEYIDSTRTAARTVHHRAIAERDADLQADALRSFYEADRLWLEAYLVDSAAAVGDRTLLSVVARTALVDGALDALGDLPDDTLEAAAAIRAAIALALGSADGERYLAYVADR